MFHHLSAKGPKFYRNFGLQRGNGLKIPEAHLYPRLYRSAPAPEFLGIFQELVNSSFNTNSQSNPGDKSDLAKSMPDLFRVRFFS